MNYIKRSFMGSKILLSIPVFVVLLAVGMLQLAHSETLSTPQSGDNHLMTITSFDATPQSGNAPLVVKFTSSVQVGHDNLPPLRWSYNFGDGNIAEDTSSEDVSKTSSISHTYAKPGTYLAVLTVTDQGFNSIKSQAITITVRSVTLFGENSQIAISGPVMVDATGHAVSSFHVGQPIGVQSVLTNRESHYQRFTYVVEAIHEHHAIDYFEGSSGSIESNQSLTATQVWTPKESGNYTVMAYALDSLASAAQLSDLMEKEITVQESGNDSVPTTSIQEPSASMIWFKYTPICCNGTLWENKYPAPYDSQPEFIKIKDYFNGFGITVIDSMSTDGNCADCPKDDQGRTIESNGKPLYYSYYFLIHSSDENKMLRLGFEKVDTVPPNAHTVGL